MTTKIKFVCACGKEVTERLNALDDTMILLAEAIENGEWQGIQDKVAKWIKYEEDRPAEPQLDGKGIQQLIDATERILKNDRCAEPESELLPVYQCSECHVFTTNQEHECE